MSNTTIRFAITRVTSDFDITENMIKQMKAIVAVEDMQGKILNVFEFIENLDKETNEITTQVQQSVTMAERHLLGRIEDSEQKTMSHILSKSGHLGSYGGPQLSRQNKNFQGKIKSTTAK